MNKKEIEAEKAVIRKVVNKLTNSLKKLDSEISETEMEQVLLKEVLPQLVKDKTICEDSIFSKMEVVKIVQIDSITEEKKGGMKSAIYNMGSEGICWLVDHIYKSRVITDRLKQLKKGFTNELPDNREIESLEKDCRELSDWLLGEFHERGQHYEGEIKELIKNKNQPFQEV